MMSFLIKKRYRLLYGGIFFFVFISCQKEENISKFTGFAIPAGFGSTEGGFDESEITKKGFYLGKSLFYDPILSSDSSQSCASCHNQVFAFSDFGNKVSRGVQGKNGLRNSPQLINLAWKQNFMWDGGSNHLEVMPVSPITDSLEMNLPVFDLVKRLNKNDYYKKQFKKAFKSDSITDKQMLNALAQFLSMLVSSNSRYDKVMKNETEFTESESKGYAVFNAKCASCHKPPLFTNHSYRDNGIGLNVNDDGRGRITLLQQDVGKFMVPSLRNAALTAPYMHDGRFETLREVLEHYQNGIVQTPNLDPILRHGVSISNNDVTNLLAFLETLTDNEFIYNSLYSENIRD